MVKERNSYPSCVWAMPSQSSIHPRMLCYGRCKLTDRLGDEMRVVKIIASDTSLSLSSAFSSDFSTEINFMIYKKQDEYVPPEVIKEREKQERDALENSAFGIYKGAGYTQYVED